MSPMETKDRPASFQKLDLKAQFGCDFEERSFVFRLLVRPKAAGDSGSRTQDCSPMTEWQGTGSFKAGPSGVNDFKAPFSLKECGSGMT